MSDDKDDIKIGIRGDLVHPKFSPGYRDKIALWEKQAVRSIRKNVGCVDGQALHFWHGTMASRNYGGRNGILIQAQYDPHSDLLLSAQGVIHLHDDNSPRFIKLRDDIRSYFRARNEDARS